MEGYLNQLQSNIRLWREAAERGRSLAQFGEKSSVPAKPQKKSG
jgi:hypothetical protein